MMAVKRTVFVSVSIENVARMSISAPIEEDGEQGFHALAFKQSSSFALRHGPEGVFHASPSSQSHSVVQSQL
jgi:hypothetical protein